MSDPCVGISTDFPIAQGLPVMNEVMSYSSRFAPNFYAKLSIGGYARCMLNVSCLLVTCKWEKSLCPPPLFANMLLVAIPFTIAFISNAHSAIYFYKTKDKLLNVICWSVISSPFCYDDRHFHGVKVIFV